MKLLYITNGISGVGGLERVLAVKTRLLIERYNYEIHIVRLKERESFYSFHPSIAYHFVEFSGYSPWGLLKYLMSIRMLVHEIRPDIVDVCDDGLKAFLLPYLFRKRSFSLIYERHVAQEMIRKKRLSSLVYAAERFCAKKFDKFVLLCEGHRKDWQTGNIQIIPNMTPFRPSEPSDLCSKRIIAVGKISEQKAYEYLLEIWTPLEKQFPDWEVCIYGEERDGGVLRRAIEKRGLKRFRLMGCCADMMPEYLRASIHVMTSRFEGLPMVMIEAQSCGLPSVSFDCPYGPREIIDDGQNGYSLQMGDFVGMRKRLSSLMADRELLRRLGNAAYLKSQLYTDSEIMEQWNTLYSSLACTNSKVGLTSDLGD